MNLKYKIICFIKKCRGLYRHEFYRLFSNWKIYVALVLYFIICILTQTIDGNKLTDAIHGMQNISGFSNLNKLLVIVAAFPFATSFCDDWKGKYTNQIVARSSKNSYMFTKFSACFITSFLISLMGLILYALLNVVANGIGEECVYPGEPFYELVHGAMPFMYVIVTAISFSMVSATYAVMGFAVSAVVPNTFVAVTSTIFMNVFMEEIMSKLPAVLNLFKIQKGAILLQYNNSIITIVFSIMVVAGYVIIAGMIFARYAGRRIKNEIV